MAYSVSIQAEISGKYFDVFQDSRADGANITQFQKTGGNNQKFLLSDAGDGYRYIKVVSSGKYLDITGVSTADGARLTQWAFTGGDNQKFQFIPAFNGKVTIRAKHSGKYLDIPNGSTADGAQVIQWPYSGAGNQRFTVTGNLYSEGPAAKSFGGNWVDDVAVVNNYLFPMLTDGGSNRVSTAIDWLPTFSGGPNLAWIKGVKNGNTDDGIEKLIPKGVIQIGGGQNSLDYVLMSSIIEKVQYSRSAGYVAPNSRSVASCQTTPTSYSDDITFASSSSASTGQGLNWQDTVSKSEKIGVAAKGGVDFFGVSSIETTLTYETAREWTASKGGTLDRTWTDSETYTTKSVVGTTVTPGTIGNPAMTTPVVSLYGLFKFGRLFYMGGSSITKLDIWSDSQPRYRVHHNTSGTPGAMGSSSSYWIGKIDVPVSYLKSIPGYAGEQTPTWFMSTPQMTLSQYQTYCKGDFAARNYAPAMKFALCISEIDKAVTCKGITF